MMRTTTRVLAAAMLLGASLGCQMFGKKPESPKGERAATAKKPAESEPVRTSWGSKAIDEENARPEMEAMRADLTREQGGLPKLERPFASAEKRVTK